MATADRSRDNRLQNRLIQTAKCALIGARGVVKAIAEDPGSLLQKRFDSGRHMLGTGRGYNEKLRDRRRFVILGWMQKELPQTIGQRRSTRFTAQCHRDAGSDQGSIQTLSKNRFAGSFAAFNCNKSRLQCWDPLLRPGLKLSLLPESRSLGCKIQCLENDQKARWKVLTTLFSESAETAMG